MDVLTLSRIQFALTISFHYIYPPLSIGLGVMLVIMEALWLKTGKPLYHQMARFWTKVFALTFAIGVATGIVMEFEFGTNWATYSRYRRRRVRQRAGGGGHLRVLPRIRLPRGAAVRLGQGRTASCISSPRAWCAWARISARSGSSSPTPGCRRRRAFTSSAKGLKARAEITDFWAMVFNPSSMDRLLHTLCGAWQAGAFLVVSVSAWYLLKRKHRGVRPGFVAGRAGRRRWSRRCCNWSAAIAARRASRKISRPSSRRSKAFTRPAPTRR